MSLVRFVVVSEPRSQLWIHWDSFCCVLFRILLLCQYPRDSTFYIVDVRARIKAVTIRLLDVAAVSFPNRTRHSYQVEEAGSFFRFGVRHCSLRVVACGLVCTRVRAKQGGDDQGTGATLRCRFRTGNSTVSWLWVLVRLRLFRAIVVRFCVRAALVRFLLGCTFAACSKNIGNFCWSLRAKETAVTIPNWNLHRDTPLFP